MFDLCFYKIVCEIMEWKDAPETKYLNRHELALRSKKYSSGLDFDEQRRLNARENTVLLRRYVAFTYPSYFCLDLRVSSKAMLSCLSLSDWR